jgi:FO synthase
MLMSDELESFTALGWDQLAPRADRRLRAALERVLESGNGSELSRDDLCRIAHAQDADFLAVMAAANLLRKQLAGEVVGYVINRNINFTNVCFIGCKFCAFCCSAASPEAFMLSPEQVAEKAVEAWKLNATEVCIQGGIAHDLPSHYYRDVLHAVKRATPQIHTHAYSPMEIIYGAQLSHMPLDEYLLMLKDAGLDSIPGTAAEILDDRLRAVLSPQKLSKQQWREVIVTAHRCGIPTTATILYGHCEEPEHWVDQLLLVREIQQETGGFTEFVPLGFIHQNTRLFQLGLSRPGATDAEHLMIHALARIALAGAVRNVQVSWVKLTKQIAQLCLQAGGNDYGGTCMEENISRLAGSTAGQYLSPAEFQARIRELGRIPAERDTTYTHLCFPMATAAGAHQGATA